MKTLFLLSLLILNFQTVWAQAAPGNVLDSLWRAECKSVVDFLASDALRGRRVASPEEKIAADFIAKKLSEALHVKVKRQAFEFLAPDSTTSSSSQNVYAFLNNHADKTILIGAHYDHIGLGGKKSLSFGKKEIHNGADDNASGVALLLALAQSTDTWAGKDYNYLFVAYSAHELGLFGSKAFLDGMNRKYKPISLVINFDMVGRMHPRERWLKVYGAEKDSLLQLRIKQGSELKFRFEPDEMLGQLDTKAFHDAGIPCLSFSTGIHDDYHKVSDDAEKINYQGIWEVQLVVKQVLGCLSNARPCP